MANASNSFFKVTFSLKVNLRSNVKEASLAESKIYRSIGQLPTLGFFICLERLAVEQSKGYYWIMIGTVDLSQDMI